MKKCFQIHLEDNVATLLEDVESGPLLVLGQSSGQPLVVAEPIALGHKVALQKIAAGSSVIKYGIVVGIATVTIQPGQWVHLHNCRSRLDERSSHLDVHTGAAKDIGYE